MIGDALEEIDFDQKDQLTDDNSVLDPINYFVTMAEMCSYKWILDIFPFLDEKDQFEVVKSKVKNSGFGVIYTGSDEVVNDTYLTTYLGDRKSYADDEYDYILDTRSLNENTRYIWSNESVPAGVIQHFPTRQNVKFVSFNREDLNDAFLSYADYLDGLTLIKTHLKIKKNDELFTNYSISMTKGRNFSAHTDMKNRETWNVNDSWDTKWTSRFLKKDKMNKNIQPNDEPLSQKLGNMSLNENVFSLRIIAQEQEDAIEQARLEDEQSQESDQEEEEEEEEGIMERNKQVYDDPESSMDVEDVEDDEENHLEVYGKWKEPMEHWRNAYPTLLVDFFQLLNAFHLELQSYLDETNQVEIKQLLGDFIRKNQHTLVDPAVKTTQKTDYDSILRQLYAKFSFSDPFLTIFAQQDRAFSACRGIVRWGKRMGRDAIYSLVRDALEAYDGINETLLRTIEEKEKINRKYTQETNMEKLVLFPVYIKNFLKEMRILKLLDNYYHSYLNKYPSAVVSVLPTINRTIDMHPLSRETTLNKLVLQTPTSELTEKFIKFFDFNNFADPGALTNIIRTAVCLFLLSNLDTLLGLDVCTLQVNEASVNWMKNNDVNVYKKWTIVHRQTDHIKMLTINAPEILLVSNVLYQEELNGSISDYEEDIYWYSGVDKNIEEFIKSLISYMIVFYEKTHNSLDNGLITALESIIKIMHLQGRSNVILRMNEVFQVVTSILKGSELKTYTRTGTSEDILEEIHSNQRYDRTSRYFIVHDINSRPFEYVDSITYQEDLFETPLYEKNQKITEVSALAAKRTKETVYLQIKKSMFLRGIYPVHLSPDMEKKHWVQWHKEDYSAYDDNIYNNRKKLLFISENNELSAIDTRNLLYEKFRNKKPTFFSHQMFGQLFGFINPDLFKKINPSKMFRESQSYPENCLMERFVVYQKTRLSVPYQQTATIEKRDALFDLSYMMTASLDKKNDMEESENVSEISQIIINNIMYGNTVSRAQVAEFLELFLLSLLDMLQKDHVTIQKRKYKLVPETFLVFAEHCIESTGSNFIEQALIDIKNKWDFIEIKHHSVDKFVPFYSFNNINNLSAISDYLLHNSYFRSDFMNNSNSLSNIKNVYTAISPYLENDEGMVDYVNIVAGTIYSDIYHPILASFKKTEKINTEPIIKSFNTPFWGTKKMYKTEISAIIDRYTWWFLSVLLLIHTAPIEHKTTKKDFIKNMPIKAR